MMAVHDDRLVPRLLVVGAKYSLATAIVWNDRYHLIDEGSLATY
jgi:hypothetical protein